MGYCYLQQYQFFFKCANVPYLNCSTVSPSTVTAADAVRYVSLVSGQSMELRNLVERLVLVWFCFFYAEIVTCWSEQLYGCPSGKVVKQSAFIYSIRRSQSVCQITSLGVHCVWCKGVCWKRHRALLCCIFCKWLSRQCLNYSLQRFSGMFCGLNSARHK